MASYLLPSLKLAATAPENGWLEDDRFLLGPGLFSGVFAVSSREGARLLSLMSILKSPIERYF